MKQRAFHGLPYFVPVERQGSVFDLILNAFFILGV